MAPDPQRADRYQLHRSGGAGEAERHLHLRAADPRRRGRRPHRRNCRCKRRRPSRPHRHRTSVKPLRDATIDYSFDQKLSTDLQQSLGKVDWLKVDGVRVMKDIAPDPVTTAITGSKSGAVLLVAGDYQLSNDGVTSLP